MLQEMRKYTKSWVASLFLGLLALSFGVWGIADIFRGNSETNVATVGGQPISSDLFQRDYRNMTRRASQQGALKPGEQHALGKQVLDGLVGQTALDEYAQHYGITATDETVSARVRSIPNFVGSLGTFDHQIFLRLIDQIGFTEQGFIDYIRGDLQRDQVMNAVSSGVQLPPNYARAFFKYLNEVRAVEYITLPASAAGQPPVPTDAQLDAYIAAHRSRFSTPEYREVSFAWISPHDLVSKMQVSDQQLRQQYELEKSKYVIPDKRTLEQITYPDLAAAKVARTKLDSGTSFEDLAKARHMLPNETQIGSLSKEDLGDRGAAVFAVPKGGVTQPLKVPVGYALIRVVDIIPGSTKTFDDVKADIRKEIATQLAGAKIGDIGNAYMDENSKGEPLPKAAAKVGMQVGHVAAIDAHGITPDGSKAAIPSDPELLAQMFKADVGEEGDPFQTSSGTTYVVKVEGIRPPKLKPLSEVRAAVTTEWQKDQIAKSLQARAKDLASKATAEKSLKGVAGGIAATVQTSGGLRRPSPSTPTSGPFSKSMLDKIFSVPAGEAVAGAAPNGGGYMVARVTGVLHPPAAVLTGPRLRQFARSIARQTGSDLVSAMTDAAKDKEGVSINQQLVDRLTGESS